MTLEINPSQNKLVITDGSRTVFDTTLRAPVLVPDAAITINNYDIDFPHLWCGIYYRQGRNTSPVGDRYNCLTCAAVIDQDWGPTIGSPRNLPDILLATVPSGQFDYLDVFATVQGRLNTPSPLYEQTIPVRPPLGQQIHLDGGCLIVEWFGPLRRMFQIILVGTGIYLRRWQSVSRVKDGTFTFSRLAGPGNASTGNAQFYFEGPNAGYAIAQGTAPPGPTVFPEPAYTIGQIIDYRGPSGGSNFRPARHGGQNSCSESLAGVSYQSLYRINLRIVPGRVSP